MGERAINLNQQLNYIEQLFSSGQIKKAQKDLRKLNTQGKKEENRDKKLSLIEQVISFPSGKTEETITVKEIVNFLKTLHEKWKSFSPVPDADFQDLNKKFKESKKGINKLLSDVENFNKVKK